jgi:hypothetical protein
VPIPDITSGAILLQPPTPILRGKFVYFLVGVCVCVCVCVCILVLWCVSMYINIGVNVELFECVLFFRVVLSIEQHGMNCYCYCYCIYDIS